MAVQTIADSDRHSAIDAMLPLTGIVAAALLMAVGNLLESDTVFLLASAVLLGSGILYFKK
jgi:hypothetical protein